MSLHRILFVHKEIEPRQRTKNMDRIETCEELNYFLIYHNMPSQTEKRTDFACP
jgi:hypothetical protein